MADLPENPNNREEEYLADMAGEDGTKPNKPWSRKEAYLDAIDGRMDGIDAKIAALATDISLKGGVADYGHLPTNAAVGDAYITEDTGILYVWVGDEWTPLNMQGGGDGGVKTLTSADYNYPANNPTAIVLRLLDPGVYQIKYTDNQAPVVKYMEGGGNQTFKDGEPIWITPTVGSSNTSLFRIGQGPYFNVIQLLNSSSIRNKYVLFEDSITQETGQSQGLVMSQKAVTDALANTHAVLYANVAKLVDDGTIEFYKEATLTTKWNAGEIGDLLHNGANITMVTKKVSESGDSDIRHNYQMVTCYYPYIIDDEYLNETDMRMVFRDDVGYGGHMNQYSIQTGGARTETEWFVNVAQI